MTKPVDPRVSRYDAPSDARISIGGAADFDPRYVRAPTEGGAGPATIAGPHGYCSTCGGRYPEGYKVCPKDATALAPADELVGTTVGGAFAISRILGEGGMGRVYEARHNRIGSKRFAVKTLHAEFAKIPDVVARFHREAQAAASLKSPYVVEVYDLGQMADGRPFIVSEFLEGEELGDRIARGGKLPVELAVRVVRQTLRALATAHAAGVVHRDMKPENVFLTGEPERPIAKVIDFGISKLDDGTGQNLTQTGMIMGTPAFMPPEQAKGERVDHRADLYAVGAILYTLLTGKRPFDKDDASATLISVLTEEAPRPRSIEPSIPEPLEMIVQRAMAKERDARFQSALELHDALAPFAAADDDAPLELPSSPEASAVRRGGRTATGLTGLAPSVVRERLVLFGGLAFAWLALGLASFIAALARLSGPDLRTTLSGGDAFSILASVVGLLLVASGAAFPWARKRILGDAGRERALLELLRMPVLVGLGVYAFAELLVRFLETVVLHRAVGVAWPMWDVLFFLLSVGAAAATAVTARLEGRGALG